MVETTEKNLPYVEILLKQINKQLTETLQTLHTNRKQGKEYTEQDERTIQDIVKQVKQMRGIIERYILRYTDQKKLTEY
jgi:hypothetical protein